MGGATQLTLMLVELRLSKCTAWGGAEGADEREEEGNGQEGWIMEDKTTDTWTAER